MEEKKKFILITNEGVTYDVKDKEDCVEAIMEEYRRFDVSMVDILSSVEICGFSAEDVFEIYAMAKFEADSDTIAIFYEEPSTVKEELKETTLDYCIVVER